MKAIPFVLLSLILCISSLAKAESCREKFLADMMKKHQEKSSTRFTIDDYEKQKKASPMMGYMEEAAVSTCEIMSLKNLVLSTEYGSLCSQIKTPYRLRCLREWIGQHTFTNAAELPLIQVLAVTAGKEDKKLPYVNSQMLITQLTDIVLYSFERVQTQNFYAFKITADHPEVKAEAEIVKKQELELLMMAQQKIVPSITEKLKELKRAADREPAANKPTREWIESMLPKLEMRLERLKARTW